MNRRLRLPNRRERETVTVLYRGRELTVGLSRFTNGAVAEVFLDAAKSGEDLLAIMPDAAVTCSLAFQHGVDIDTLRKAVTRDERGAAAGPLGCVLDAIVQLDGGDR